MDHKNQPQDRNRRNAIKLLVAGGAAIYAPFVWTRSKTAPKRQIVVRDAGGLISTLYRKAFYDPFERETGIKVIGALSKPEPLAQIRMMVEKKHYSWDIANLNHRSTSLLTSGEDIYLEKHGLEDDSIVSGIAPQFLSPYGVGTNVYTTVLTYRTDHFKNRRAPQSWQDFWDANNFPGRRSLRNLPFETIEIALMAAGESLNTVYPCDLAKVFNSLNKIEPHIPVWWTTGAQSEHLLNTGEVELMSAFISKVQQAIKEGKPLAFSWDQHIYGYENWTILKGTPNADLCREFIRFASHPERQASLAPEAIGPTHLDAFKYIEQKQITLLQTYPDNLKRGLLIDASYWLTHQGTIFERFNEWRLGHPNA